MAISLSLYLYVSWLSYRGLLSSVVLHWRANAGLLLSYSTITPVSLHITITLISTSCHNNKTTKQQNKTGTNVNNNNNNSKDGEKKEKGSFSDVRKTQFGMVDLQPHSDEMYVLYMFRAMSIALLCWCRIPYLVVH